jgi:signal transduction histidine kinase
VAAAAQSADATFLARSAILDITASPKTPVWIVGDPVALQQLFLNLLLNSAQAMDAGQRASVTIEIDGAEVRTTVADVGHGISREDLPRVFDPFFSTKDEGTGLGLAIARQIAAAHGGSLAIESASGEGTRAEVRLPLAASPS